MPDVFIAPRGLSSCVLMSLNLRTAKRFGPQMLKIISEIKKEERAGFYKDYCVRVWQSVILRLLFQKSLVGGSGGDIF